jgi:rhodanese-related sulfurtransferase
MPTVLRIAVVLVVGVAAAAVANRVRPKPLPWILDRTADIRDKTGLERVRVTLDQVRTHLTNYTAAFIDARAPEKYEAAHLAGAYNVPADQKEAFMGPIYQNVAPQQLVIIYCDGGNCDASESVFEHLRGVGFTNLRIFKEGWEALATSDLPKQSGPAPSGAPDAPLNAAAPPDGALPMAAPTGSAAGAVAPGGPIR